MNVENLGVGVMINMLGGNQETVEAIKASVGEKIVVTKLADDVLRIELEDGSKLSLWDAGQSCCESRYMRTDDDLSEVAGAELLGFELRDAPSIVDPDGYGDHDVQFLVMKTSNGDVVFSSHNEHNGYYGGFSIVARLELP